MTEYKIMKTPMGYLPLFQNSPRAGWWTLKKSGKTGVHLNDAPAWPDLFHETEAEAGKCINDHAEFFGSPTIWKGETR